MLNPSIEVLKSTISIESIIGSVIELRKGKGLCTFHDDHNPSLTIKDERWRCWSCGEGGDVIDFVKKLYNLPTKEAIDFLANKAGIKPGKVDPEKIRDRDERRELLLAFKKWERNYRGELALILRTVRQRVIKGVRIKDPWLWASLVSELTYMDYVYTLLCGRDDHEKHKVFLQEMGYGR
jgi:hypothetical protein